MISSNYNFVSGLHLGGGGICPPLEIRLALFFQGVIGYKYSVNLNSFLLLLFHIYGHLMSFENQKWPENSPEVISEGLKFKIFGGA